MGTDLACDHAAMQINCWHEVGRKHAPKDVVRVRRLPPATVSALRASIRAARKGEGDGVLFTLERGFSDGARAAARIAVGAGVVVAMVAAVVAFLAPDVAGAVIGFGVIPAAMTAGLTAWFSYTHDTGLRIDADGRLRVEGWSGIRDLDLRSFARVTVAEDPPDDIMWLDG